jgi:hypothetical protein
MDKAEFTKEELYDSIRYAIYCHFFEHEPSSAEVLKDYNEFWKTEALEEHMGDCTNSPCPCIRCQADWIEEDAKKSFEYLWRVYIKD